MAMFRLFRKDAFFKQQTFILSLFFLSSFLNSGDVSSGLDFFHCSFPYNYIHVCLGVKYKIVSISSFHWWLIWVERATAARAG